MDKTASHHTLPDLSRLRNGRSPTAWQIELIDQVTWCSNEMRTSAPQKKPVTAPPMDMPHNPPTSAGSASELVT